MAPIMPGGADDFRADLEEMFDEGLEFEEWEEDEDEEEEEFREFFYKTHTPKSETKPKTETKSQSKKWQDDCTAYFDKQTTTFPKPPHVGCNEGGQGCIKGDKLGICHHELKTILKESLNKKKLTKKTLKKERLRFHPDRFSKDPEPENQHLATEVFQLIQQIIDDEK